MAYIDAANVTVSSEMESVNIYSKTKGIRGKNICKRTHWKKGLHGLLGLAGTIDHNSISNA